MLRRIVKYGCGPAIVIAALLVVAAFAAFPLFRYLSRPADLPAARRNGQALARTRGQTVVVVTGHPDDSEFYTGGTLATLARNGNRVVLVVGTSGEKGGNGIPNLAKVREAEERRAGRIIGYSRIVFARNPDRELKNNARFRDQLRTVFEEERPGILITFDAAKQAVGYRHSDHIAAGAASLEVAKSFPTVREAYLFSSSSPNAIVEVAPQVDVKSRAASMHKSQMEGGTWTRYALRLLRFVFPGSSRRGVPAGMLASPYAEVGIKNGELFRLVRIDH